MGPGGDYDTFKEFFVEGTVLDSIDRGENQAQYPFRRVGRQCTVPNTRVCCLNNSFLVCTSCFP